MFTSHQTEKFIDRLSDFSIIVEGKRDKKTLETLELDDIFDISGKPTDCFIESLPENRNYIILANFDKEGELLRSKICELFFKHKLKFNSNLRKFFKVFFGMTQIEESISKIEEDVYHGKISTINYKIFNRSGFHRRWCGGETRCYRSNFRTN